MSSLKTLFPQTISDSNDLSLISSCDLKWFRKRCQWLKKPARYAEDLEAGIAFASAMQVARESFYSQKLTEKESVEKAVFTVSNEMYKKIERFNVDVDRDIKLKTPQRMELAVKTYFKEFPLDDISSNEIVPASYYTDELELENTIEHSIVMELPLHNPDTGENLKFKGKLDLLANDSNDSFYIVDEKTTKRIQSNQEQYLIASGQFLGYAKILQTKGINVHKAKIRKVGIYTKECKAEEFEINITPFAIENWYRATLAKLKYLISKYENYKNANLEFAELFYFNQDFGHGCTAYNKPCEFIDSCTSRGALQQLYDIREPLGLSEYKQSIYDSNLKEEIPLNEYLQKLGK